MSRELLKRALDALDEGLMGTEAISLSEEIETYLAQPEPEPVALVMDEASYYAVGYDKRFGRVVWLRQPDFGSTLYQSPPDQSARVAELAADGVRLMETITELRSNLTALQAKREPLSDNDIALIASNPMVSPCSPWWLKDDVITRDVRNAAIAFARAIEAAHGIGG